MFASRNRIAVVLVVLIVPTGPSRAQDSPVTEAPCTIWRFVGIPQGVQKVRDVLTNRRGNFPGLERRDPLKRIADPANLESENPAIKAAAEIKKAEDMKKQKIKAIKYLATIGCGCYDKDGKVTEALLAATDDCTPDVRLAAIEAIENAASGECCKRCGSTSCCNEAVTKRLSEIAYERDDNGCPLEPSAEVRAAAKRALCVCCPRRAPAGMIEEDYEEAVLPTPVDAEDEIEVEDDIVGESAETEDEVQGESEQDAEIEVESTEESVDSLNLPTPDEDDLAMPEPIRIPKPVQVPKRVQLRDGTTVRPVTIQPANFRAAPIADAVPIRDAQPVAMPRPLRLPVPSAKIPVPAKNVNVPATKVTVSYQRVTAKVSAVNAQTGEVLLSTDRTSAVNPRGIGTVYHRYLTGEREVASLKIAKVGAKHVLARVTDRESLRRLHAGDRVELR